MIEHEKAQLESRHQEEDEHRSEKDIHLAEFDEMIRRIYDDMKAGRELSEHERRESTEGIDIPIYCISLLTSMTTSIGKGRRRTT